MHVNIYIKIKMIKIKIWGNIFYVEIRQIQNHR